MKEWASLVGLRVKNLPAMENTWLGSLWEDSLEKEIATHSSILAWRISWTEEHEGIVSEVSVKDLLFKGGLLVILSLLFKELFK